MKFKTAILMLGMAVGAAYAQNPDIIQDTRSTLQNVEKKQVIDQNAALAVAGQAPASTPGKSSGASASVAVKAAPAKSAAKVAVAPKAAAKTEAKDKPNAEAAPPADEPKPEVAVEDQKNPTDSKKPEKTYSSAGKRDPFVSPVVSRSIGGSGCSAGKRCLAIDQIALTGVVKSDSGMIAVVVNALNKAYFLRENDPVFNGYVVKITGDSIVFKETVQDKLGKPFEREVTKKIFTPAV
jgi:Tfp pilus assembly protein PilP